MIIYKDNRSVINDLYIHDSELTYFNIDLINNNLMTKFNNTIKKFVIEFFNVLHIEVINANFWAGQDLGWVIDWYYNIQDENLDKLIQIQNSNNKLYEFSKLANDKKLFFGSTICFNTGNEIKIICEKIDFKELILEQ